MKRAAGLSLLLCGAVALAACSSGPGGPRAYRGPPLPGAANPGQIVALELGMARMIREEGQAAAFAHYAADDAVIFVPQPVDAREWLQTHDLPPSLVSKEPEQVWASCDGSLAVVKGAWQRENGAAGWFINVWERQDDGEYRFVLSDGGNLADPMPAPDMVQADVAECRERPTPVVMSGRNLAYREKGASKDWSLYYQMDRWTDGSRAFSLQLWKNGERRTVLEQTTRAPGGPGKP